MRICKYGDAGEMGDDGRLRRDGAQGREWAETGLCGAGAGRGAENAA